MNGDHGDHDELSYNDFNSDDSSKSINNSDQDIKNEDKIRNTSFKSHSDYSSSSEIIEYKKRKLSQETTIINNDEIKKSSSELVSMFKLIDVNRAFEEDSNFKIKRIHSNWPQLNPKLDLSFQLSLSFIGDKIYQVHIETNDRVAGFYQRAQKYLKSKNSIMLFEGHNASRAEVWNGLLDGTKEHIKELIFFAKQIPGFEKVNKNDLKIILENKLPDFYMIKHSFLFIDGESFIMLPNNIQYTKSWQTNVIGNIMTNAIFDFADEFNKLGLTAKEIALLVPYLLTMPGIIYVKKKQI